MNSEKPVYQWIWPRTGGTATHEGLDSEIFDTERCPLAVTFVRETIQNVLDARKDKNSPVVVNFKFCQGEQDKAIPILDAVKQNREACDISWPPSINSEPLRWLLVEDENTTGLEGDISRRGDNFWGYWLNFGRSNKPGESRGGRGIGRVTFLLASEIQTVIGVTQREGDQAPICCGMSVLKSGNYKPENGKDVWRGAYAYLAAAEKGDVYSLHGTETTKSIVKTFGMRLSFEKKDTGFSLAIPFPRQELTADRITAAAIENFAPAILNGTLKVVVNEVELEASSLPNIAERVRESFLQGGLKDDPKGLLKILESSAMGCLLYTSPSPRDLSTSRMPSSA